MNVKRCYKKRNSWCNKSEIRLVEIWANRISELRGTRKNRRIVEEMRDELHRDGMYFTVEEMKTKMSNLGSKYKKELAMLKQNGSFVSNWPLFSDLHRFLRKQDISQPELGIEHEYDTSIKCGEVHFIKNDWYLQLVCADCGKEMLELRAFLRHSLQHHYAVKENEINLLISQLIAEKNQEETEKGLAEDDMSSGSLFMHADDENSVEYQNYIVKEEYEVAQSNIEDWKLYPEKKDIQLSSERISESTFIDDGSPSSLNNLPVLQRIKEELLVNDNIANHDNCEFLDLDTNETIKIKLETDETDYNSFTTQQQFEPLSEIQTSEIFCEDLVCKQCSKVFRSITDYSQHIKEHIGFDLYECPKCDESFILISQLKDHLQFHAKNKLEPTKINSSNIINLTEIKQEQDFFGITPKIENPEQNDAYDEEILVQNIFNAFEPIVKNEDAADERIQISQQVGESKEINKSTICKTLRKTIKNTRTPALHKKIRALKVLQRTKLEKKREHKCSICQKKFFYHSTLLYHKKMHAKLAPLICDICGATFSDRRNLYTHRKRHLDINKNKSTFSDKSSVATSELEKPAHLHSAEHSYASQESNNYDCELCGRRFFNNISLLNHQKSHTEEKPYPCKQCEVTFRLKAALVQHMRLHSKIKEYECTICKSSFAQKSGLHLHMKRHIRSGRQNVPYL